MELEKRKRGRPQKEQGRLEFWRFVRGAMAMHGYDQARERGEKHSVAVREAVDFVKHCHPGMSISEAEVRRTLAASRPRDSKTILRFERKNLTEDDIKKHRSIREQIASLQEEKGLKSGVPPNSDPRDGAVFTIRIGTRPNYPRHNRKNPKE
jgi:hypothetical protein